MDNSPPDIATGKKWFQRRENFASLAGLCALAWATVVFGMPWILVAISKALVDTYYLIGLLAGLGALAFLVLDHNVRTFVSYSWMIAMKRLTRVLPAIESMEVYCQRQSANLEETGKSKDKLSAQVKTITRTIDNNAASATKNMSLAKLAGDQGDQKSRAIMAEKSMAATKSNEPLIALRAKMIQMLGILNRVYDNASFMLEKNKETVRLAKIQRAAIMEAHAAMESGWKVIGGGSELVIFEQGLEANELQMAEQCSSMERIMDLSDGLMTGADLERGLLKKDALDALDKWEKETNCAILGTDKSVLISQAYDVSQIPAPERASVSVPLPVKKERFSDLVN
jgi:hypothetical protein